MNAEQRSTISVFEELIRQVERGELVLVKLESPMREIKPVRGAEAFEPTGELVAHLQRTRVLM